MTTPPVVDLSPTLSKYRFMFFTCYSQQAKSYHARTILGNATNLDFCDGTRNVTIFDNIASRCSMNLKIMSRYA